MHFYLRCRYTHTRVYCAIWTPDQPQVVTATLHTHYGFRTHTRGYATHGWFWLPSCLHALHTHSSFYVPGSSITFDHGSHYPQHLHVQLPHPAHIPTHSLLPLRLRLLRTTHGHLRIYACPRHARTGCHPGYAHALRLRTPYMRTAAHTRTHCDTYTRSVGHTPGWTRHAHTVWDLPRYLLGYALPAVYPADVARIPPTGWTPHPLAVHTFTRARAHTGPRLPPHLRITGCPLLHAPRWLVGYLHTHTIPHVTTCIRFTLPRATTHLHAVYALLLVAHVFTVYLLYILPLYGLVLHLVELFTVLSYTPSQLDNIHLFPRFSYYPRFSSHYHHTQVGSTYNYIFPNSQLPHTTHS